jgi:hypothetical protein
MLLQFKTKPMQIENHGQIAKLELPAGWLEGESRKVGHPNSLLREFHPQESDACSLALFYRGTRVDNSQALLFKQLLAKPDHMLSSQELKDIVEVLGAEYSHETFKPSMAKTSTIDGKRVLCIEGHFAGADRSLYGMFVDSDGTGSAIQEIYFTASKSMFFRYLRVIDNAFKNIIWK